MMKNFLALLVLVFIIGACGTESTNQEEKKEEKEQAPMVPEDQKHEKRIEAVEVNDLFSLSQAHAFVLIDSLLKMDDLDSMLAFIPEVQIELVSIRHRVNEIQSEIEGAAEFKKALLDQFDFFENGLKNEIPKMIGIAQSGKQEIADEMYFNWVKENEERTNLILAAQLKFVEKNNIRFE